MAPLVTISPHRFFHAFNSFRAKVKREQEGSDFEDFQQGYPRKEEFYKTRVHGDALNILKCEKWHPKQIGSGQIIEKVIEAIEIPENNLVEWRGKKHPAGRSHLRLIQAREATNRAEMEAVLFSHFRDKKQAPQRSMERLISLFGRRYDLIAYLFYLLDWERFMPIAPLHFDRIFAKLDIRLDGMPLKTLKKCSWENYASYNGALKQIRDELALQVPTARLIDAHSFCWMLRKVEISPMDSPAEIEPPEPTTIVDFEARARILRLIGGLAEEAVLRHEKEKLLSAGRKDLSQAVTLVSNDHTKGYDILSYEVEDSGRTPRHVEVKAIRRGTEFASFYFTENERQKSRELPNYWIYLVTGIGRENPEIRPFRADVLKDEFLSPVVHVAKLPIQLAGMS